MGVLDLAQQAYGAYSAYEDATAEETQAGGWTLPSAAMKRANFNRIVRRATRRGDTDFLQDIYGRNVAGQAFGDEFEFGRPSQRREVGRRVGRIEDALGKLGITPEQAEGRGIFDPETGRVDFVKLQGLRGIVAPNMRPAKWSALISNIQVQEKEKEGREFYEGEVRPLESKMQEVVAGLLEKPAFDEETRGLIRSESGARIRGQQETSLRRASAALGLRGLDPSSPVGALISQRAVEAADQDLSRTFTMIDLETRERNRAGLERASALASDLAARMANTRNAALSGDFNAMIGLQSAYGSLQEAIQSALETTNLQRGMLDDQLRATGSAASKQMYAQIGAALVSGSAKYASSR